MMDQFAWPWVFALLVLAPLTIWKPWQGRRGGLMHTQPALLSVIGQSWRTRLGFMPAFFRLGAVTLLIVALARPQEIIGEVRTSTEGVAIELVVDRSSSMEQPMAFDRQSLSRLEVVKRVAREFVLGNEKASPPLRGRAGDLVGLVAFAGFADTICPLVRGHAALDHLLAQIQTAQFRGEDGTAIGDALLLAAARLKDAEEGIRRSVKPGDSPPDFTIASKVIILLTDGQNNGERDPMQAAQLAADWGIRIYTIGIGDGAADASAFPSIFSRQGVDRDLLTRIARLTDGQYFAADDADALRRVYERIDSMEKTRIETEDLTDYRELFPPIAAWGLSLLAVETLLRTIVLRRTA